MRKLSGQLELSASDLSQFLGCRHRTGLDLAVAAGQRKAPVRIDPVMELLRERGFDHERRFADELRAQGLSSVDLADYGGAAAVERCTQALREGVEVIFQGALADGRWFGRPDVLRRIDRPSALGDWSYEIIDTKLALQTRGGTVLQLALYCELLAGIQAVMPEWFYVVTPDAKHPVQGFRAHDFLAYFRLVRQQFDQTSRQAPDGILAEYYPEPVDHCEVCPWWQGCDERRRRDDHLSLVAGVSRLQRRELQEVHVNTLKELGTLPLPLPFKPRRGAGETYVRAREQARVQLEGRSSGKPVHELILPIEPDRGLAQLPEPSAGDIFLDLEGDPFAAEGGREYLFGLVILEPDGSTRERSLWAWSAAEERSAFEAVVDEIEQLWASNPGMHIYHYAPYEPAALKRLMGRYATREAAIDRMLRAERFVDLHTVVRNSLRASVERYSIKDLEAFYGFSRSVPLEQARTGLRIIERAVELRAPEVADLASRAAVEGYNLDDCQSARRLRDWLETLRAEAIAGGQSIPRPIAADGAAPEKVDDRARRVHALATALTAGIPLERAERTEAEQGRWLLANLLDYHRRESKAPWWEFFRLRDLSPAELLDERAALSGLQLHSRVGGTARSAIDRYTYPIQDTDVRKGDQLNLSDGTQFGTVHAIDRQVRTVDVKKAGKYDGLHPQAVFAHSMVNTDVLADVLLRIGDDVLAHGIDGGTSYEAARQLLCGKSPRLRQGRFEPLPGEPAVQFAIRTAPHLDRTVLAIQGPPGAGKTFTGARMICELVKQGARVGITAVGHKVISNLLAEVVKAAAGSGVAVQCVQKVGERSNQPPTGIDELTDNAKVITRIAAGTANVVGGTAWLWARPDLHHSVDVLFVDEAGQMCLADVLAASQAARSVVLLGDPQQLEQPQQGSHPEGTAASALEHLLGGHQTIPADRGIFLPETWRLPPSICAFTSEVFYEGRLNSLPGLERQVLTGTIPVAGSGLWVLPVEHEGNQNSSPEELDAIGRLVDRLLASAGRWTNRDGAASALSPANILVIAPYNAQVALLSERLEPRGVRVGTVDKFQGQQAPIVIYSMATSIPEDAPRGMEFLYSLNRLNVATSRAQCACIVVASPRLFEPECRTPRQMQLANALCRYVEMAHRLARP